MNAGARATQEQLPRPRNPGDAQDALVSREAGAYSDEVYANSSSFFIWLSRPDDDCIHLGAARRYVGVASWQTPINLDITTSL